MGLLTTTAGSEKCLHIEIDGQHVSLDPDGLERAARNRNDLGAKIAEAVRAGYGVTVEE